MRWVQKSLGVSLLAFAAVTPASAGQTEWVEIAPEAHIRLITSDVLIDGKTLAAIEIDMPQSTKTYWRIPGETGIPLLLDTSGSKNVSAAKILWPYPERSTTGGYLDFVYQGPTILPLELALDSNSARLEAGLILGVCDEICVPVRVSLDANLNFKKSDTAQSFRIKQAMADVPLPWTDGETPINSVSIDEAGRWVYVDYVDGAIDPNSIIIDTGKPIDLFALPQKSPESGLVTFELLDSSGNQNIEGSPLTVTFMTVDGVFELTKTVQPVAATSANP